jgi:hypothetical protein
MEQSKICVICEICGKPKKPLQKILFYLRSQIKDQIDNTEVRYKVIFIFKDLCIWFKRGCRRIMHNVFVRSKVKYFRRMDFEAFGKFNDLLNSENQEDGF